MALDRNWKWTFELRNPDDINEIYIEEFQVYFTKLPECQWSHFLSPGYFSTKGWFEETFKNGKFSAYTYRSLGYEDDALAKFMHKPALARLDLIKDDMTVHGYEMKNLFFNSLESRVSENFPALLINFGCVFKELKSITF